MTLAADVSRGVPSGFPSDGGEPESGVSEEIQLSSLDPLGMDVIADLGRFKDLLRNRASRRLTRQGPPRGLTVVPPASAAFPRCTLLPEGAGAPFFVRGGCHQFPPRRFEGLPDHAELGLQDSSKDQRSTRSHAG